MKPYLNPNPTLAFIIEWGVLIISLLLVFSPFIYLGIRKWKRHLPVSWKQVFASYFFSFLIYFVWEWIILNKIDRYIYNNFINTWWLQSAIGDPGFKMIFIIILGWPTLVFYCIKLVKGKFTKKNFVISLFIAILGILMLFFITLYWAVVGLAQIANKYF